MEMNDDAEPCPPYPDGAFGFPGCAFVRLANAVPDLIGHPTAPLPVPDRARFVRGICRIAGVRPSCGGYGPEDVLAAYAILRRRGKGAG